MVDSSGNQSWGEDFVGSYIIVGSYKNYGGAYVLQKKVILKRGVYFGCLKYHGVK